MVNTKFHYHIFLIVNDIINIFLKYHLIIILISYFDRGSGA
jgi:hypothetical protein